MKLITKISIFLCFFPVKEWPILRERGILEKQIFRFAQNSDVGYQDSETS